MPLPAVMSHPEEQVGGDHLPARWRTDLPAGGTPESRALWRAQQWTCVSSHTSAAASAQGFGLVPAELNLKMSRPTVISGRRVRTHQPDGRHSCSFVALVSTLLQDYIGINSRLLLLCWTSWNPHENMLTFRNTSKHLDPSMPPGGWLQRCPPVDHIKSVKFGASSR